MRTVEGIMRRTAVLPLSVEEIKAGEKLSKAANPAPWKMGGEFGSDWSIADFGMTEGPDGYAQQVRVQTDGCNASRFCGTAADDAALTVWLRNNVRALLQMALEAHRMAKAGGAA